MFRAIRRSFSEAVRGMLKNGLMTVTSIFVVTSCIFVFGVFEMITLNINYMSNEMANDCQLEAYITRDQNMDDAAYEELKESVKNEIMKLDNVDAAAITFVSGKQKFEDYKKKLDKNELASFEGLPDNLIPDSFSIRMQDIAKSQKTAELIAKLDHVESVENSQQFVEIIENIKNVVKNVSVWIIVVFALVSLFIISNTIKLTVHNRRREINIMKYVGATDSYIRGPFIMEGILVGLFSALFAFFISQWSYVGLMTAINEKAAMLTKAIGMLDFGTIWLEVVGSYILLGCFIGAFGSAISVRRYLKV